MRSLLLRLYGAFTTVVQPLVRRKLRRRAQAEPGEPNGGVRGAAADVFRKGGHVLETAPDLFANQVDTGPAHCHDVEHCPRQLHDSPCLTNFQLTCLTRLAEAII